MKTKGEAPMLLLFLGVLSSLMKQDEWVFELVSQMSIHIDLLHVSFTDFSM